MAAGGGGGRRGVGPVGFILRGGDDGVDDAVVSPSMVMVEIVVVK